MREMKTPGTRRRGAPTGHSFYGGGPTKGKKYGPRKKKDKEAIEIIRARLKEELEPILTALIEKCKKGDSIAIREALDRLVGRPTENVKFSGKKMMIVID